MQQRSMILEQHSQLENEHVYMENPQGIHLDQKRMKTFEMIRWATSNTIETDKEKAFQYALALHDHNPAL